MVKNIMAMAMLVAAAACSQPPPEEPAPPPPPAMRIEALNSLQLAQMVRENGPEGVRCQNASRVENMGVVPANAPSRHAAHEGERAYAIFCIHPDVTRSEIDPDQQWVLWVKSVDPIQVTVDRCYEPDQHFMNDNICWVPFSAPTPTP
jgi:hypothetical protein